MKSFRTRGKKFLNELICTPNSFVEKSDAEVSARVDRYGIVLSSADVAALSALPRLRQSSVGSVLVALEAKACVTEPIKACPRLYDELSSSFQTSHGDTKNAVAAAFVTINAASAFVSPVGNKDFGRRGPLIPTLHTQPKRAERVLEKITRSRANCGRIPSLNQLNPAACRTQPDSPGVLIPRHPLLLTAPVPGAVSKSVRCESRPPAHFIGCSFNSSSVV